MSWNDQVIEEFRNNRGIVGGPFAGRTILLLHTSGRRTGEERVSPLVTVPDGDRYVVVASKGGAPSHPHWYLNLKSNPEAEIEVGTERFPVRAILLEEGPERDRLYARHSHVMPAFKDYEIKTEGVRTIPVVVLERNDDRSHANL